MCLSVSPAHVWQTRCSQRPEGSTGSLELDLQNGCELPCGAGNRTGRVATYPVSHFFIPSFIKRLQHFFFGDNSGCVS